MMKLLAIFLAVFASIHGLIHFMAFVAYWPLAPVSEISFKTSLLGGQLNLSPAGMRIYSIFWLLTGIGLLIAAIALAAKLSWWAPVMLAASLLSLILCILDWGVAYRGALIDLAFLLILGVVFGLRIQPGPFPPFGAQNSAPETMPLPAGLPGPVNVFYRQTYDENIPIYETAVLSGRGTVRFMGITFPARLRFIHNAGEGYRHYIETTFYGFPILKVNEQYLEGHTRLELPFGVVENDPKVDSAANQGLWGEMSAYPAAYLTDPRTRWEELDEHSAKLYVPYGDEEQEFKISFDPVSGAMTRVETLRYRDEKVGALKWWGDLSYAQPTDPLSLPVSMAVTWEDEGSPWLVANIEEIVFNPYIEETIQQRGP